MGRDNRADDVFMPKDNTVILEDGEMNEIDHELEEFKRFCLMIKPLKNRPKVAVQVNLKDLAFKKLSYELNNSYNVELEIVFVIATVFHSVYYQFSISAKRSNHNLKEQKKVYGAHPKL